MFSKPIVVDKLLAAVRGNAPAHVSSDALMAAYPDHAEHAHVSPAEHDTGGEFADDRGAPRTSGVRVPRPGVIARELRLYQWLKNLLVFVPLLAAHDIRSLPMVECAMIAFLAFGLCASSVYLVNDLMDLEHDRRHPVKCKRPLASGEMPVAWALALAPLLLAGSLMLAWCFLPPRFTLVLGAYYSLTLAYSLVLKRCVMIDVVVLAALYTVRIVAGSAAIGAHLTFWLLAFSMFIFVSLAFVKRYAELRMLGLNNLDAPQGRGYTADDLTLISSLGTASGYLAVLVLAMYIQDEHTTALYRHPQVIWLACPLLLYWVSYTWTVAHRGRMTDDPILYAARDRVSLLVIAMCGVVFSLAI